MAETCVVCREALDADRCGHCGAARAPGGYVVRRLVAQTPHSRLYLADAPGGAQVALKELLFSQVPGVKELEAFEREATLLKELTHPDVPRFVASFQEGRGVGTRLYLAQEFVDGGSLADRLKSRRFDESEARDVARRVLRILDDLHRRTPAIIHRDIKPANLLFRADGSLVLVDFGAARTLANDATHRATLVGTFGYMPPEQLGGTVDATSDLYALGATLVHLVSGKSPADLAGHDLAWDVDRHIKASAPFRAWLKQLVARRREDRFQSAREALDALDAPPPVVAKPKENKPNPAVPLAIAAALLVGGAGAAVLFATSTQEPALRVDAELKVDARPDPQLPAPVAPADPVSKDPPVAAPTPRADRSVRAASPAHDVPGVDVVKLERVQPAGTRRAFYVDAPRSFDPRLTIEVPPEAACTNPVKVVLDRVAIRPNDDDARWILAVGVETPDEKCREVRMSARADGSSVTSQRVLASGNGAVTLDVSAHQSVVEWSLGPPSKAVVVVLDAEKATATVRTP